MKKFLSLLVLATAFISAYAVPSGAAAGMDLELIKNIKNYIMPKLIK